MKKIIVASKNPVKIAATLRGFQKMFPDEEFSATGLAVHSGVNDQPVSDAETLAGAKNRVENAANEEPGADYYVGIEGGIEGADTEMTSFAWVAVRSANGLHGKGKTGTVFLPLKIATLIQEGKELGEADDIVFGLRNSKQAQGAVGILTDGVIDRTEYYTGAVVLALVPFKNPGLYNPQ